MEFYPLSFKVGSDLSRIFYDAVVDQDYLVVAAHMRMGVVLGHSAVCRPSGMANAEISVEMFFCDFFCKLIDPSCGTELMDNAIFYNGYSCRVIAPVFMFCQPFQDNLSCVSISNISHDAAHMYHPLTLIICSRHKQKFAATPYHSTLFSLKQESVW